jgi:hypothetical protein
MWRTRLLTAKAQLDLGLLRQELAPSSRLPPRPFDSITFGGDFEGFGVSRGEFYHFSSFGQLLRPLLWRRRRRRCLNDVLLFRIELTVDVLEDVGETASVDASKSSRET